MRTVSLKIAHVLIAAYSLALPCLAQADATILCRAQYQKLAEQLTKDVTRRRLDFDSIQKVFNEHTNSEDKFVEFQDDLIELLVVADAKVVEHREYLQTKYGLSHDVVDLLEIGLAHHFEEVELARMSREEFYDTLGVFFRAQRWSSNPQKSSEYLYLLSNLTRLSVPEMAKDLGLTEPGLYQRIGDYGLSVENAFESPLSAFQLRSLRNVGLDVVQFEGQSLAQAAQELSNDRGHSIEETAELLGTGREALHFYLHYARETNRGVFWDRQMEPEGISEEGYAERLYRSRRSTQDIANAINERFGTQPGHADYRTAASVTAKLKKNGVIKQNSRLRAPDVLGEDGVTYLKLNGQLQTDVVTKFVQEHYFMPIHWLASQLGVKPYTVARFARRHSIPLRGMDRRTSLRSQSDSASSPSIAPTSTSEKSATARDLMKLRQGRNAEYEIAKRIGQEFEKRVLEAGIQERLPRPVSSLVKFKGYLENGETRWKALATDAEKAEQSAYSRLVRNYHRSGFVQGIKTPWLKTLAQQFMDKEVRLDQITEQHTRGQNEADKREFKSILRVGMEFEENVLKASLRDRLPKSLMNLTRFTGKLETGETKWEALATDAERAEDSAYHRLKNNFQKPGFVEGIESPWLQALVRQYVDRAMQDLNKEGRVEKIAQQLAKGQSENEKQQFMRFARMGMEFEVEVHEADIVGRLPKGVRYLEKFKGEMANGKKKWPAMATDAERAEDSAYERFRIHCQKPGFIEGIGIPWLKALVQRYVDKEAWIEHIIEQHTQGKNEVDKNRFKLIVRVAVEFEEGVLEAGIRGRLPTRVSTRAKFKGKLETGEKKWTALATDVERAENSASNQLRIHYHKPGFIEAIKTPWLKQLVIEYKEERAAKKNKSKDAE